MSNYESKFSVDDLSTEELDLLQTQIFTRKIAAIREMQKETVNEMTTIRLLEFELRELLGYMSEADAISCRSCKNIIDNSMTMLQHIIEKISTDTEDTETE